MLFYYIQKQRGEYMCSCLCVCVCVCVCVREREREREVNIPEPRLLKTLWSESPRSIKSAKEDMETNNVCKALRRTKLSRKNTALNPFNSQRSFNSYIDHFICKTFLLEPYKLLDTYAINATSCVRLNSQCLIY